MKIKLPHYALLVSLLALFVGSISIQAQNENGLVNVRLVTVKVEHLNDWISLQQQSKDGGRDYENRAT